MSERFPFRSHRTLAEVAETERLSAKNAAAHHGGEPLTGDEWRRLRHLSELAAANNP